MGGRGRNPSLPYCSTWILTAKIGPYQQNVFKLILLTVCGLDTLVQAYSRTNRVDKVIKQVGQVVTYCKYQMVPSSRFYITLK